MNREELGKLIIANQDSLYRVAKTLLRSDDDCGDAIGEAIVKAFSRVHTLRNDGFAKTWLIRIVINECYNLLRSQARLVPLEDGVPISADSRRDYTDLYDALTTLPERTRLCVTLHYIEGYSIRETARIIGTTETAVKSRLFRARQLLRDELTTEV